MKLKTFLSFATKKGTDKFIATMKQEVTPQVAVMEPPAKPEKKTVNQVIEEIHETFYTEVDRLLASAKIANSLDTDKQELIDKCARLKSIGFHNTKEVKEAEAEIARLEKLKLDNEAKKTLVEAINYFSFRYPNYKFITEDSVKKICAKYNLIYGAIDRYIGTVPDKNLKHIEDFKVVEDDECYVYEEMHLSPWGAIDNRLVQRKYHNNEEYKMEHDRRSADFLSHQIHQMRFNLQVINMKCPLEIAAPIKDFNMAGMEVKNHKISKVVIPDPIVLKPVIFNGQKHYLIVTAWGLEAGDPDVVNANHN